VATNWSNYKWWNNPHTTGSYHYTNIANTTSNINSIMKYQSSWYQSKPKPRPVTNLDWLNGRINEIRLLGRI
jgi:hypothetical protein